MVTLLLSCTTLSFATPRRFIPTHQKTCKRPQIYKNICKTTPGSLLPQTTEWRVLRNGLRFSSKSCVYKKTRRRTAGLARADDITVLQVAASDGRVLASHDRQTMPKHFS